jgi:small GTP-binding protein
MRSKHNMESKNILDRIAYRTHLKLNYVNKQHVKKIAVIGDNYTGKTSLMHRLQTGDFIQTHCTTVSKIYPVESNGVIYNLCDYTGDVGYLSGLSGIIIMFDLTSKKSFQDLPSIIYKMNRYFNGIPLLICGNKSDSNEKKIHPKIIHKYCDSIKSPYCEISVKNNINCLDVLNYF